MSNQAIKSDSNEHSLLTKRFESFLRQRHCTLGDNLLPTLPQPLYLPLEWRPKIAQASEQLSSALEKVSQMRVRTKELDAILPIEKRLLELAKINPGYSGLQLVLRLDAILDLVTGDFKVIEFNCGDPSGMGWNDSLLKVLQDDMGLLNEQKMGGSFHVDALCPALFSTLNAKYEQYLKTKTWMKPERPLFVFVCKKGSMIESDFRAIIESYQGNEFILRLADPGDFVLGERLTLNGQNVDLIYRDIVDDFIGDKSSPGSEVLLQALCEQKVCLLNPLGSAAGDFKNINAILRDEKMQSLFDHKELSAIEKYIPWTSQLNEKNISYALKRREKLVLKPNLGFGGQGVIIGQECTPSEWEQHILYARQHDYTIQEFVKIPEIMLPKSFKDIDGKDSPKKVNVNFWVHQGRFSGAFARISESSVINVCQGGALLPVCWRSTSASADRALSLC